MAGRGYQFPGNHLKLQTEDGEIDFIVGGRRTSDPVHPWKFERRTIEIDTPWETAIKKMFYRPSTFKVRDAFDLAAVIDRHGPQLGTHLGAVEDRLDRLLDRLDALSAVGAEVIEAGLLKSGSEPATRRAGSERDDTPARGCRRWWTSPAARRRLW